MWLLTWADVTSREFGLWLWLERLSWLVAAAGIPLLIYQFRTVANELTKRPKLMFGLAPAGAREGSPLEDNITLPAQWVGDAELSEPIKVEFRVVNHGQRTARDLLMNIVFPPLEGPDLVQATSPLTRRGDDGSVTMIRYTPYLHPAATQVLEISLQIRRSLSVVPVVGKVAMSDTAEQVVDLKLRFSHQ